MSRQNKDFAGIENRKLLTIPETAKRCIAEDYPISENMIRKWVKSGNIPVVKAGSRTYINWAIFEKFLEGERNQ